MEQTDIHILELVAAELCGESLSQEEKQLLHVWRKASSGHEELYQHYQQIFDRQETLKQWEQIHQSTPAAHCFFRHSFHFQRRNLLKYAAVLLPLALLSAWLLLKHNASSPVTSPVHLVQNDIAPGKQKAHLKLEDGKVIPLADSCMAIQTHQNIQVGNGGILQYQANSSTPAKAVYHTLAVSKGAEFQLILPDGTKVWLNSDSELKYPNVFNAKTRQVYLKGEAYFEVTHSEHQPFIVKAGDCAIRVLGTAFNVSSYAGEKQIVTTLVKGKVAYAAGNNRGELTPGEQCIYGKETQKAKVQKVDVNRFISWKNGLFIFDHATMEELGKQISRWYNVEVIFPDDAARLISFTGAMERYKPVSYLVQLLNETNTVDCRLEGNRLVFRQK